MQRNNHFTFPAVLVLSWLSLGILFLLPQVLFAGGSPSLPSLLFSNAPILSTGIIGGQPLDNPKIPVGTLFLVDTKSPNSRYNGTPFCTGVLNLTKGKNQVVTTAGHCFQEFQQRDGELALSKEQEIRMTFAPVFERRDPTKDFTVRKIFHSLPHPQDNYHTFLLLLAKFDDFNTPLFHQQVSFDYALCQLDKVVTSVTPFKMGPISRDFTNPKNLSDIVAIGHGLSITRDIETGNLRRNIGRRDFVGIESLEKSTKPPFAIGRLRPPTEEGEILSSLGEGDSGGALVNLKTKTMHGILVSGPTYTAALAELEKMKNPIGSKFGAVLVNHDFLRWVEKGVTFFQDTTNSSFSAGSKEAPRIEGWKKEEVFAFEIPVFEKTSNTLRERITMHEMSEVNIKASAILAKVTTKEGSARVPAIDLYGEGTWLGQPISFAFQARVSAPPIKAEDKGTAGEMALRKAEAIANAINKADPLRLPECMLNQVFMPKVAKAAWGSTYFFFWPDAEDQMSDCDKIAIEDLYKESK